jgi:hypothetical protein
MLEVLFLLKVNDTLLRGGVSILFINVADIVFFNIHYIAPFRFHKMLRLQLLHYHLIADKPADPGATVYVL